MIKIVNTCVNKNSNNRNKQREVIVITQGDKRQAKIAFFTSNECKTGYQLPYPDLEPGNEFWNRVRVPGSCYKSLLMTLYFIHYSPHSD